MTEIMCSMCKKTGHVRVLVSKPKGHEIISMWSCGHCRHAWRSEPWRISDPIKFFGYAQYTQPENVERISAAKKKLFQRFLQWANKANPQTSRLMVDFGCSYGTVLQIFKEHNWQVMGVEISPTAQKTLDERNLPWASSLEGSCLLKQSVDVVIMSDCICYLPDPLKTLHLVRSYMKSDGFLLLRQPTRGGLVHTLSKLGIKKALSDDLWLDHVHLFSRKSTMLVLNQAGFSNVKFIKEKGYKRSIKGELIHRILRAVDYVTLGTYDLTPSWIVIASATENLKHMHQF